MDKPSILYAFTADYTVLDFETTGISRSMDEIIEIGAISVRNHCIVDSFSTFVHPHFPISGMITQLTGITNQMVYSAPSIQDCLPGLLDFIGTDFVLGHNVCFDLGFLNAACIQYGFTPYTRQYLDTMRISKRLYPEYAQHRLCDLKDRFGLSSERDHRALSDVVLTHRCYQAMRLGERASQINRPPRKRKTQPTA